MAQRMTGRRRGTAVLALALTALLTLGACGDDGNDTAESDSGGDGTALPEAEGNTGYPLTIETAWGETTLEDRPERIAAVSGAGVDVELLAMLGVTPVAAPSVIERASWTTDALPGEIEEVYDGDASGETPHETIAQVDPDLVVAFKPDLSAEFDQFSSIAPVVAAESEDAARGDDWKEQLRAIAEALDLSDLAEEKIAENDRFFEQARADNPDFEGVTASYLVQYGEDSGLEYFSAPGSGTEELLLDLGLARNPGAGRFADNPEVSGEMIADVGADVLIVTNTSNSEEELDQLLLGNDLFQELDAVQGDNYAIVNVTGGGTGYEFEGEEHVGNLAWALGRGGPLGKQWAAERLIPMLQSALG